MRIDDLIYEPCPNWEMEGSAPPIDPETGAQECCRHCDWTGQGDLGIHWVIVGGESGAGARPMRAEWADQIYRQCAAAGVPFFMKQMGGPVKSKMEMIPDDLFIRQFPQVQS